MTLVELLRDLPPPPAAAARETLRAELASSGARVAVVDDDPTGTQTVHGVWVTTEWSPDALAPVLGSREPVFYVSTNSRAMTAAACAALSVEVGNALREAARATGARLVLASRSDSTLRGHFPAEVAALCRGMALSPQAVLLAPAFFEGGRYTVGDVHWVEQRGELVPAAATEGARDPDFGYRSSDLRAWVEEKTGGAVRAPEVASMPLELVRGGGVGAVAEALREACARPGGDRTLGRVVVVNAACYEDLDVVALAASRVESEGFRLVYRCAASFVKARGAVPDRPLLRGRELLERPGPGLVLVGSYVDRTTRQLEALLASGLVDSVELDVDRLVDPARRDREVRAAAERAERALRSGSTVAAFTSRSTHLTRREGFLALGRSIMEGLCAVARSVADRSSWVLAKGGITSVEVARALGVRRARVLGQVARGVPVWRLGEDTPLPGAPYVVFPGNVGDERTLVDVVAALRAAGGGSGH